MPDPIRVLLVEDDEDDFVMTRDLLREIDWAKFELSWIADYDQALRALENDGMEVALVDYRLGARDGVEFVREAIDRGCTIPIIVLTGQGGHEVDLAAMQAGAADFLNKAQITAPLLERSIRYSIQQKRTEEQRIEFVREQAARREAEAANRSKDEFLAMLGHELRNPLAAITNALSFLRIEEIDPEESEQAQDIMDRQLQIMTRLIDDLLDVARVTQGKINLHKETIDLAHVTQQAVAAAEPLIAAREHQLHVSLPKEPVHFEADPVRIEQVLTNLLHNAAKYMEPGGQVRLTAECQGPVISIRVRDTGIGMSPEVVAHAFDLFTQAKRSLDRSEGGLGIGLTMVKRLVELHGGTVTALSEGLNKGSEFIVRLPLCNQAGVPSETDAENGHASVKPRFNRRILVVEDNRDAAASLSLLLKRWGYEVHTVHDGKAALEVAEDYQPEVVLLDISLPGLNGYQVARQWRSKQAWRRPILVAVTGFGRQEDLLRSRDAGFDHHLTKPVRAPSLRAILASLEAGE